MPPSPCPHVSDYIHAFADTLNGAINNIERTVNQYLANMPHDKVDAIDADIRAMEARLTSMYHTRAAMINIDGPT